MHPFSIPSCMLVLSWVSLSAASPLKPRQSGNAVADAGATREGFLRQILAMSNEYGTFQNTPAPCPLKVGIVGAGAAGLYAGMLLESLGVDYEILEGTDRIGGRIFTYRFDQAAWDASEPGEPDYYNYYDVGAMRFPSMAWMDRVIGTQNNSLVSYVNSKLAADDKDRIQVIPYIFAANDTYRLFNSRLAYNQVPPTPELFNVLQSQGGSVPDRLPFAATSTTEALTDAVEDLINALDASFDDGFETLMQYDSLSLRAYLRDKKGFSPPEIDWMETVDEATTHFDMYSLSQAVLEQWIFTSSNDWTAIEGGMDRITNGMTKILKNKPILQKPVQGVIGNSDGTVTVSIKGGEKRTYAHVINTVPLGVMQNMDMSTLNLDYNKTLAMRKLQYDPAGKIGVSFKTRWWEENFKGGQSFTDLSIRRCVYPSYGVNTPGAAGAMIASYTWGQDSSRLGAFYHSDSALEYIKNVTIAQLARMNHVDEEFLHEQLVDIHFWDWYAHGWSNGAFALFGPDEFSTIMPSLLKPAFDGKVHFAGEALSSGHAWIIGAVNSAFRTVVEVLAVEQRKDLIDQLVNLWGTVDEVDMGWYTSN